MKKLLLALAAATAAAGTAQGADLPAAYPPYKAPALVAPPPYDWSGLYVGVNLGYGFGRATGDVTGPAGATASASEDLDGVLGGAQIGYNWQMAHWIFGLETDFQFSGQDASSTLTCATGACSATRDDTLPWFGTFRGRIGYAFDRLLLYTTVGVAYGQARSELKITSGGTTATASQSDIRAGLAVGGGIEYGLAPHWTGRLEYLYLDSGDIDNTATVSGVGTFNGTTRLHNNVVRLGLNYRF